MGIKIGRLDFGPRGLLPAATGLVLLGAALCCNTIPRATLSWRRSPLQQAYGSYALLNHAPKRRSSRAARRAAPRGAQEAIGVVLYVNVRLAWACDLLGARLYGVACALLAAKLTPAKAFDNGNTFVFVVPIFVEWVSTRCGSCAVSRLKCAWNAEVAALKTVAAVQFVALRSRSRSRWGSGLHPPRAALRFICRCRRRHSRGAGGRVPGRWPSGPAPPGPLDRGAAASSGRRALALRPWPRPSRRSLTPRA